MTDSSTQERVHSRLGGSSAYIWSVCPGYAFLVDQLPPEAPSSKAQAGTRLHEICEYALGCFLSQKLDGTTCDWKAQYPDYTEEEEYHVNMYIKYIWEEVLQYSLTGKAFGIEDKFVLDDRLSMFGFVDFWCLYVDEKGHRTLCIVDYKSGIHYVPAAKNLTKNRRIGL